MMRILLVVGAVIAGIASVSTGEETQAAAQAGQISAAPAANEQRFEGYLFLDAEGNPLPFQSDDEILSFLRTAKVVAVSKIPVGVTRPKQVLLERNGLRLKAAFKNIDERKRNVRDPSKVLGGKFYLEWRDSYVYDVAVYHLDRLLGLDRVPPTAVRKLRGNEGSLSIWLEGTITENERLEGGFEPPEIARFNQQRATTRLLDNLVANRDANLGNTLIDGNWRLWYIDCSRCFGRSPDLLYPEVVTHCDRRLWRALKELDRSAVDEALSAYLGPGEIDALFVRRDRLVELLQARIDEWGEEIVLFDERPPTDKAPWAGE